NPFNPQTTIQFDVPLGNTTVKLEIYDILGRNVFTLLNQQLKPGKYSAAWNASGYSSGIYFCAFYTNNKLISTNKLILVK
ncbi:MAG TPA: T9SS type A sorting domain-containing protein, partial [Ignavibacteria bacterium]|nr:T9SS type A sorting domain-containing protein [Ignavibacteria bacterium]